MSRTSDKWRQLKTKLIVLRIICILQKKKLIQRRHQNKKTEAVTIRATKIANNRHRRVVLQKFNRKAFCGEQKLSPAPILESVVSLYVHLAISFGDLMVV